MKSGWQQRRDRQDRDRQGGAAVMGVLLVAVGLFFLGSELLGADLGRFGWPIFVIAPGLFLLVMGLAIPHEGGLGAAIPGGIVTSVGLILAFQNATEAYASWAYCWALVAPGSIGVAILLFGLLHRRRDLVESGLQTTATGLGLFVAFGLLFENVMGIDDLQPDNPIRVALPFIAVALGAAIVVWNLLPRPRSHAIPRADSRHSDEPPGPTPPPAA